MITTVTLSVSSPAKVTISDLCQCFNRLVPQAPKGEFFNTYGDREIHFGPCSNNEHHTRLICLCGLILASKGNKSTLGYLGIGHGSHKGGAFHFTQEGINTLMGYFGDMSMDDLENMRFTF